MPDKDAMEFFDTCQETTASNCHSPSTMNFYLTGSDFVNQLTSGGVANNMNNHHNDNLTSIAAANHGYSHSISPPTAVIIQSGLTPKTNFNQSQQQQRRKRRLSESFNNIDEEIDDGVEEEGLGQGHTHNANNKRKGSKPKNPFAPECSIPLPFQLGEDYGCYGPVSIWKRNERERHRVRCVNDGYEKLRSRLPYFDRDKRLSKVETLRLAIRYISHLQQLLTTENHYETCACELAKHAGLEDTSSRGSSVVSGSGRGPGGATGHHHGAAKSGQIGSSKLNSDESDSLDDDL